MKIIEDKVTVYPPHAICSADIPVILSAAPAEWTSEIQVVRLSAANPHPRIAYYSNFNHTFTIKSRGLTKEWTLLKIYRELAGIALGIQLRRGHNLQARDVSRVEKLAQPYVTQVLPLLSQKKVWLDA